MAAHDFETFSAGIGSQRLDDEFPSDSANGPEERRDTSPSASLNLAASTPARLSQQSKTRLRTALRNSPARPGHSDRRTELFGHFSPARNWSNIRHRAPSYQGIRARNLDHEGDQDVPAFTPLPPPRLHVPRDSLRPGQLFHEDPASSPISSRLRVSPSPTTWSPLFRARQHYPPTKSELTPAFETSAPHDHDFEPNSRVEAWLENVRPGRFEAKDVLSSFRDLHLSRERTDSVVDADVHHGANQRDPSSVEASESGHTQLPPWSPQQHFSPSPIRGHPRTYRSPSAIPAPQTPLTQHHHHFVPHTTNPTQFRRRPGTAFSSPPAAATSAPGDDDDDDDDYDDEDPRRRSHESSSTAGAAASLSSPSRDSVPPQPCITLSPPPQQQQLMSSRLGFHGHAASPMERLMHPSPPSPPLIHSRRRPRQRGPAPAPARTVVMETTGEDVPVTPKAAAGAAAAAAARKPRFGGGDGCDGSGGEDEGPAESMMLSPDVYLWRGDSERRARFREMVRRRYASYRDGDLGVGEGGG